MKNDIKINKLMDAIDSLHKLMDILDEFEIEYEEDEFRFILNDLHKEVERLYHE